MLCVCVADVVSIAPSSLTLDLLDGLLGIGLDVLNGALKASLFIGLVLCDSGDLDEADHSEEEVDGGEEVVLGLDDEAPASPDDAGAGQGKVLGEGELLGGTSKVGDAGEDESPLHDRSPKVHSLEADLALPHAIEPRLLLLLGSIGTLPPTTAALSEVLAKGLSGGRTGEGLSEEGARGAEDGA